MRRMIIKVCGMRDPDNIRAVCQMGIDWMGFIFYPPSPRFVDVSGWPAISNTISSDVKSVGVFVNETEEIINQTVHQCGLNMVQLHGQESPELCHSLKMSGVGVIKAFSVSGDFDFDTTKPYEKSTDFFLFDTKTPKMGGSGEKFDWNILDRYKGNTPFLLSGGIGPGDATMLQILNYPQLAGYDLNSRFEILPALKNIELLNDFIQTIQ